jgi:hypothetical protein
MATTSPAARSAHEPQLLLGPHPREDVASRREPGQRRAFERVELFARRDTVVAQARLPRDRERGRGVVPGRHHHADAGPVAERDGGGHVRAHRIGERDQADEAEDEGGGILRPGAARARRFGHRQHAQPVRGRLRGRGERRGPRARVQGAKRQHGLRRALDRRAVPAGLAMGVADREESLGHRIAAHGLGQARGRAVGIQDRALHGIERALLAGQRRDRHHRRGRLAPRKRVPGAGHPHAILGERPGLVRAEHCRGSQHLHRREAPREDAVARDAQRAKREEHGEHDRKFLREHRHREREASKDPAQDVAARMDVEGGHDHAQGEPERGEDAHHVRGLDLEARAPRRAAEERADPAQLGADAGRGDLAARRAAHHQRARVRHGRRAFRARMLFHRRGFAREQRFVHGERVVLEQPHVRGHAVAFAQQHHVAAHHLGPGNAALDPVAHDQRARAREVAQRLQRALGAPLLHHRDGDDHDDGGREHQRLDAIPQQQVDRGRPDEQEEHRLAQHVGHEPGQAMPLRRGQGVGTLAREPNRSLGRSEAHRKARRRNGVHASVFRPH